MSDLRLLKEIAGRHKRLLAAVSAVSLALAVHPNAYLNFVDCSQDDEFRLEFHHTGFVQSMWYRHARGMHSPHFVRLYRNTDNRYFGESPVIDAEFGNGTVWLIDESGEVSLGDADGYRFKNVKRYGNGLD